jgi:hypothetical protein
MRKLERVCGCLYGNYKEKQFSPKFITKNGFLLNKHQMGNNIHFPTTMKCLSNGWKKGANGESRDKCMTMNNIESHFMRCVMRIKEEKQFMKIAA